MTLADAVTQLTQLPLDEAAALLASLDDRQPAVDLVRRLTPVRAERDRTVDLGRDCFIIYEKD